MRTEAWQNQKLGTRDEAIFCEIAERLFPEYDGEKVTWEQYGWNTPDGSIEYVDRSV